MIIVGARCAGAPTAMLLARRGHSVLLLDRAIFPSDIPHGHFIHRHGPELLADWGLFDRVVDTGCPAVSSFTLDLGDFPMKGTGLHADGVPMGVGPRRLRLDELLVEAAVEAGAELREEFAVREFTSSDGRVTGVHGHGIQESATVVVGADGRNSMLAKHVDAPLTESAPAQSCWYFSYWSGVPADGLEIYAREGLVLFAFPTNDGLLGLFAAWPAARLNEVRGDLDAALLRALDAVPELRERVSAGRREERIYGATQLPNFIRRPQGPGWALVGDAGCHKDPYFALGVCDAFRDAQLLADALHEGLTGQRPMDEALASYERARDAATIPDFHANLVAAKLGPPPPELLALRAAIRGDEQETRRFFMAHEGREDRAAYFSPENIKRIMATA